MKEKELDKRESELDRREREEIKRWKALGRREMHVERKITAGKGAGKLKVVTDTIGGVGDKITNISPIKKILTKFTKPEEEGEEEGKMDEREKEKKKKEEAELKLLELLGGGKT